MPEILIADIQVLIVEGIKALLRESFTIETVVGSKYELQKALQKNPPRILILDYPLLDFNGYDELKEIIKSYPETGVIILSNNLNSNNISEFNKIGIRNILHKSLEKEELYYCLEALLKGKKYYSGYILDMMLEVNEKKERIHVKNDELTVSETEIVRLIAAGLTNKEIARRKYLSVHTIMTHRKNIMKKLAISNASELTMYAIKAGIIDTIEYHI